MIAKTLNGLETFIGNVIGNLIIDSCPMLEECRYANCPNSVTAINLLHFVQIGYLGKYHDLL